MGLLSLEGRVQGDWIGDLRNLKVESLGSSTFLCGSPIMADVHLSDFRSADVLTVGIVC